MISKIYSKYLIFYIIILCCLTIIINRIVDPLWFYRDISINGLNVNKSEFHSYENQIKPIILRQVNPNVIIISNSFLEIGFNPDNPALTNNGKLRSYNYGIPASNWDSVYCNVLYAVENTDVSTVIIGIQPVSLPLIDCGLKNNKGGLIDKKKLLLSFDALRASFNTIRRQQRLPTHENNGMSYYHRNNNNQIEQVFKLYFNRYINFSGQKNCKNLRLNNKPQWTNEMSTLDVKGLKHLLALLISRNIKVKLVVYPNHALWMELMMNCRGPGERWINLYQIASVVEEINRINEIDDMVELWDFQGTSDMITERIVNYQVKYWQDTGHFNFEMGDAMLDVMFNHKNMSSNSASDEFGVRLLTPNSVVERFYTFFKKRDEFIKKNPWFMETYDAFVN